MSYIRTKHAMAEFISLNISFYSAFLLQLLCFFMLVPLGFSCNHCSNVNSQISTVNAKL
jgi:hypothetical protein